MSPMFPYLPPDVSLFAPRISPNSPYFHPKCPPEFAGGETPDRARRRAAGGGVGSVILVAFWSKNGNIGVF